MNDQIPSRFIQEIPKKLAPEFDGASWNITQAKAFFADWLNTKVPTTVLTFGASQPARETSRTTAKSSVKKTKKASEAPIAVPVRRSLGEVGSSEAYRRVKTVTQKVKEAVAQRYAASKKAVPAEPVKATIIHAAHGWRTNQPVSHKSFGIGVIKNIESRSDDQVFLTVQFKSGTKKIEQKFVVKV
jgi:hypothetical protein